MSGGAFFPGMEASWLFAKNEVWAKPFRVDRNKTVGTIPVPGEDRRDLVLEAGAFSQQMALPWQADFMDCAAGGVADPSVVGKTRRVAWWPANRPDEVFPLNAPTVRLPWARAPDPQAAGGYHEMQTGNEMVKLWSTLGFIVETAPDGASKDFYEVEFNKTPAAAVLVAAATPKAEALLVKPASARRRRRA
jgi:hypothetical protein